MKLIKITGTTILCLLLGIAIPAYAQHERQDEKQDRPEQQQHKAEQARPQHPQRAQEQERQSNQNKQQQHAQQQQRSDQNKHAQGAQQEQRQDRDQGPRQAQQRTADHQPQRAQQQRHVERAAWQEHRARSWQTDHRNWQQRGGYNGYRIPDDRYRGYFGPHHRFRIYGLPFLVVGGYPRFQYQGYWFSPVDPWPEYWANNWYDTDDVYVTYVDSGYYLFNRRYPNVGIAISISM
jgi:hypothetical protein